MTKIACIGAGYFARFHVEAWTRLAGAELVAICDADEAKARALAEGFGVNKVYKDVASLCREADFEVADIITPPETHLALVRQLTEQGKHIICQKPLAPTLAEAKDIHRTCVRAQVRFMVHENFRFQPWHRELRRQIEAGAIGDRIHSITQRMRMGDGWQKDAYLSRQPYFRTMPRLLMYETGIHYIDVLRYLTGDEVHSVYAQTRTLNAKIAGEDDALVILNFAGGTRGIIDGNRYNEANHPNPRYTFGTTVVEGNGGTLRLYLDGRLTLQRLGESETDIDYQHNAKGFAGDCVYRTQENFLKSWEKGEEFETDGADYLKSLTTLEAVYQSAEKQSLVRL